MSMQFVSRLLRRIFVCFWYILGVITFALFGFEIGTKIFVYIFSEEQTIFSTIQPFYENYIVLKYILDNCSWGFPNYRCSITGWTLLHRAANCNCINIVNLLLSKRADPNIKNNNGTTPLHDAVSWGHVEIVSILLNYGADPNIKDNNGTTPLYCAVLFGHTKIVSILLKCGADVNYRKPDQYRIPYLSMASGFRHFRIVKVIISESSVDINALDNNGFSALDVALANNHLDIAKYLLDHQVTGNFRLPYGNNIQVLLRYYEKVNTLNDWRPWNHHEFPICHRDAIKTCLILAKSRVS